MSDASPLTAYFTFQYDGVMTLNSLTNNYTYPPANGGGSPPACYSFVTGSSENPETVPAVVICGVSSGAQYGTVVSYNLPDGSMLTINASSMIEFFNDRVNLLTHSLSPGSRFSATGSQSGNTLPIIIAPLS